MTPPLLPRAVLLIAPSCILTGCSLAGAPSFELVGAYFPAWMLCALIGIIAAAGAAVVLKSPLVKDVVPLQLAVCTAVGILVGLLVWAVTFR